MKKGEKMEAEDMVDSFFKHVLVSLFVIMFMLTLLWMTMA